MEGLIMAIFWVVIVGVVAVKSRKNIKHKPGMHPTTINKPSSPPMKQVKPVHKPTVASDGHSIPKSKDITCEGQYGHDHGDRVPRYIVHEEPTEGYCILNGKKVALKDCWKL